MDSQNIIVENREKIAITNAVEMGDFNEETVNLTTSKGGLMIKGSELKIQKLSIEEGEVIVTGKVNAITYTEKANKKDKKFLEKLFK